MITLTNVTKRFGHTVAVDNVSLQAPTNSVLGVLGPNGAGKTTTIRMIAGLIPPSQGSIAVNQVDPVSQNQAVRAQIGYLPEANPLYTEMPVRHYLKYRAALFGLPRRSRKVAIQAALERCELEGVSSKPCGHLSKGFRQRVGVAAAILHDPPILILDEPTSGLDPQQIKHIRTLIRQLAQGRTILLISHILAEVQSTCDRLAIFNNGSLLASGPVEEIRSKHALAPTLSATIDSTHVQVVKDAITANHPTARVSDITASNSGRTMLTVMPSTADTASIARTVAGAAREHLTELKTNAPSLEQIYTTLLASSPSTKASSHKDAAA